MKASELRIGNYIIQNGEITTVEKLKRSLNDWDRLNDLRSLDSIAIPLSEDWLNKSALQKRGTRDIWDQGNFVIYYQRYNDAYSQYCKDKFYFGTIDRDKNLVVTFYEIKHLHQLQNLYFDLEGKELKFEIESNE